MKILGFQNGHDVSYCVLEDGIPIIHEELERHLRLKEPKGSGLQYALDQLKDISDIRHFVMGNKNGWNGKSSDTLKDYYNFEDGVLGNGYPEDQMAKAIFSNNGGYHETGHHQAHAANAFYTSPYEEALVITIDGGGYEFIPGTEEEQMIDTAFTIWQGKGNKLTPLEVWPNDKLNIGSAWSMYTKKIFGLSAGYPKGHQAGTVMAMACVGDKEKYWKDFYDAFVQGGGKTGAKLLDNCTKYKVIADKSEQDTFDIAASLQYATEVILRETLNHCITTYKPTNICLSGGVILNSVVMGKVLDWFNIKNIFIDPVPYDAGLAIGAARYAYHHILDMPRIDTPLNRSPYLGVTYSEAAVRSAIDRDDCIVQEVTDSVVLALLAGQNIISVFHGGAESGRRALGNRSILADPRSPDMKDLINEKVKHRQWYRPFAPSILREDVKDWFKIDIDSPYMSFVIPFRDDVKYKVPAVVHLDGTGRLQTVTEDSNHWYYNFIKQWKAETGVPILLNTSFNDREPIVETPEHAVNCFMGTNIDYLYFSDYNILINKKK